MLSLNCFTTKFNCSIFQNNKLSFLKIKKFSNNRYLVKSNQKKKGFIFSCSKSNVIEDENSIERFCSWLLYNGVNVYNKSTWGRAPHSCLISNETTDEGEPCGRGLVAFKNILQGEKIIELPEKIVLKSNQHLKLNKNQNMSNEYDNLALFLIYQKSLGEKSIWKPYFDTLPDEQDLNLLFRWNIPDILFLKGSKIIRATLFLKEKMLSQFHRLDTELFQKNRLVFPPKIYNLQSWEWALSIIFSRAIFLKSLNMISLIPYVDFLNHNPFSISYIDAKKITFSENYEISVYSDKPVNKFEQIFITYGSKSNLELLMLYGFILERNPFDSVEIRISISTKDNIINKKKSFLFECSKTEAITFPVFYSQYPKEFLEFLRLCVLREEDLNEIDVQDFDYTNQNKIELEKAIQKLIVFLCEKNLKNYFKPLENENIYALLNDKITITKNQKISIKQVKCEKKILNKLRLNFANNLI
jgi:hypothetical protein